MLVLKVLIILTFIFILWQDARERLVYWFCFPVIAILGFFIQVEFIDKETILANLLINVCFVFVLLVSLWVYSKLVLKSELINRGIGIGDVLFFFSLTCCFSIISFWILFIFSLIFALLLHSFFSNKSNQTIPLAGYMSLFFAFIYGFSFFKNCNFIFAY